MPNKVGMQCSPVAASAILARCARWPRVTSRSSGELSYLQSMLLQGNEHLRVLGSIIPFFSLYSRDMVQIGNFEKNKKKKKRQAGGRENWGSRYCGNRNLYFVRLGMCPSFLLSQPGHTHCAPYSYNLDPSTYPPQGTTVLCIPPIAPVSADGL